MKIFIAESEPVLRRLLTTEEGPLAEAGDVVVVDRAIQLTRDLAVAVPVSLLFHGPDAALDTQAFALRLAPDSAGSGPAPVLRFGRIG